jgi:peptidase E
MSYFVRRGQTFKMPKQICFIPTAGRKVTSIQLASDDAENPVTIRLTKPV